MEGRTFFNSLNKEYKGIIPVEIPKRVDLIAEEFTKNEEKIEFVKLDREEAKNGLLKVHSNSFLNKVLSLSEEETMLGDNNFEKSLPDVAFNAISTTLKAAEKQGFAIVRPPGHHAHREKFAGFCYFNNIAIALMPFIENKRKVAVIDLDAHYGDGTHDILSEYGNCFYASIHADTSSYYPFTQISSKNSKLINVNPNLEDDNNYIKHVKELAEEVKKFNADILGISIGFDTFSEDGVLGFSIKNVSTYGKAGEILQNIAPKSFAVLEGGYHDKIGGCALEFYKGLKK